MFSTKLGGCLQIQLPLHEPHTILLLSLFKDQQRRNTKRLTSNPPHMVGKLRLRLNTLAPGHLYSSKLPMLANRKEGGRHTATADLQAKVLACGNVYSPFVKT